MNFLCMFLENEKKKMREELELVISDLHFIYYYYRNFLVLQIDFSTLDGEGEGGYAEFTPELRKKTILKLKLNFFSEK